MSIPTAPYATARQATASSAPLIAAVVTLSVIFAIGVAVLLPDRIAPADMAARMAWIGD